MKNLIFGANPLSFGAQPFLSEGSNTPQSLANRASEALHAKDYGVVADGITNNTANLQEVVDKGEDESKEIILPSGTINITELIVKGRGRIISGAGKRATFINSPSGAHDIVQWGDASLNVTGFCDHGMLRDLSIVGNAASTGGLVIKGVLDDNATWSVASRYNNFQNVRISDIDAGSALRVSAWGNTFTGVEMWESDVGIEIGREAHSTLFLGCTSSSMVEEAFLIPSGVPTPGSMGIAFVGGVLQNSGGTNGMIDLQGGSMISFINLYTEGLDGLSKTIMHIATEVVIVDGMRWSAAGSSVTDADIVLVAGVNGCSIQNVQSSSDCNSVLRITGTLVKLTFDNINQFSGTAINGQVFDETTRKATFGYDVVNAQGLLPRTKFRAQPSEKAVEIIDSVSGNTTFSITGDSAPVLISSELTIATGVIAVTRYYHSVDTQDDDATDDLITINGGTDGQMLILRADSATRTVVVKDNTGNIQLAGNVDFSLDHSWDRIQLQKQGSVWVELSRATNA